jgi:hypothetical protein
LPGPWAQLRLPTSGGDATAAATGQAAAAVGAKLHGSNAIAQDDLGAGGVSLVA